MTDYSHYRVTKETIYRRALIVSKVATEISDEEQKIEDKIISQLTSINGRVNNAIDQLWKYTNAKPPWVNFRPVATNTNENEIIPVIELEGEKGSYYRALIGLKDLSDDTSQAGFLEKKKITHLIGINVKKPYGWGCSDGITCANINTSLEKIPLLIEDIALDIAMFYVKMAFERKSELTIADKLLFSKSKAEFAIKNKFTTYYGPILDNKIEYISFAAICREPDGISVNYKRLIELWTDFTVSNNIINWSKYKMEKFQDSEFIEDLKKYHRHYGSLKLSKIKKSLLALGEPENETFYFVTTFRKPNRIKVRKQVANLFKRQIWKPYLFKIIKHDAMDQLKPYAPYLLFYKFTR